MRWPYLKYLLALLLFGSNGVVASRISLSSESIVFLRAFYGCLLLTALYFISGKRTKVWKDRSGVGFVALSGIAMGVDWLLLFEAYSRIGVSLGMIINYCGPVIVILFSVLVFKERLTRVKLVAMAAAVLGMVMISGGSWGIRDGWGLVFAVISAFCYAGMVIFNKMAPGIKGIENASLQLFFAFLSITIFTAFKSGLWVPIESGDLLPVLWLGLVNTGLCCYLYFSAISDLPVQSVAVLGYLEPVSAVVFSVVLLGERLTVVQVVGAILIIGGALFAEVKGRKRPCEIQGRQTVDEK